jgi:hypothetical protein
MWNVERTTHVNYPERFPTFPFCSHMLSGSFWKFMLVSISFFAALKFMMFPAINIKSEIESLLMLHLLLSF